VEIFQNVSASSKGTEPRIARSVGRHNRIAIIMSAAEPEDAAEKAAKLRKLAEEAEVVAEVTADPNGRRALQFVALAYERLAKFVRTNAGTSVPGAKPPKIST
jgi:hypothetical protein